MQSRYPPRRILAATDLGPVSAHALEHLAYFLDLVAAKLYLLHVLDDCGSPHGDAEAAVGAHARKALGWEPEIVLRCGDPAAAVLEEAMARRADLIVLGTHESGQRRELGSVASTVVREAARPVLVVRQSAILSRYLRILCPIASGRAGSDAFDYAAALAETAEAKLVALHVVESVPELGDEDTTLNLAQGAMVADVGMVVPTPRSTSSCAIEEVLARGDPADAIREAALSRRADLVVMGRKGGEATSSTTERVMEDLPAPLLVVPTQ